MIRASSLCCAEHHYWQWFPLRCQQPSVFWTWSWVFFQYCHAWSLLRTAGNSFLLRLPPDPFLGSTLLVSSLKESLAHCWCCFSSVQHLQVIVSVVSINSPLHSLIMWWNTKFSLSHLINSFRYHHRSLYVGGTQLYVSAKLNETNKLLLNH